MPQQVRVKNELPAKSQQWVRDVEARLDKLELDTKNNAIALKSNAVTIGGTQAAISQLAKFRIDTFANIDLYGNMVIPAATLTTQYQILLDFTVTIPENTALIALFGCAYAEATVLPTSGVARVDTGIELLDMSSSTSEGSAMLVNNVSSTNAVGITATSLNRSSTLWLGIDGPLWTKNYQLRMFGDHTGTTAASTHRLTGTYLNLLYVPAQTTGAAI